MNILLLGLDEVIGPLVVRRLVSEGDVVGVVEQDPLAADRWRAEGAHVAAGSPADADLVERAAQHARSIALWTQGVDGSRAVLDAVLEAGRFARETPRVILVGAPSQGVAEMLTESAFDYVVLRTGASRRRLLRRLSAVAPGDVAEAVSAADDLAGSPRLDVDLTVGEGWERLGLAPR